METTTPINPYPVSNSRLNQFELSPKHLLWYLNNRPEPTPAMKFGSAFHMRLLQPELFNDFYSIAPNVDKRSKIGKEIWEQFSTANTNKESISTDDVNRIDAMIEAINDNAHAADLINNLTHREVDSMWIDAVTKAPMRGIIDGIANDYLIDVKTCANARPDKFQRDAWNMNYHRQAAIYMDSYEIPKRDFYFIAIEKDAPYGVSVHRLSNELIEIGREKYRKLLVEYQVWIEMEMVRSGYEHWTISGVNDFDVPYWVKNI